jgi:uncharacterized membrane protein YjgN (DUF898 family)
MFCFKCGSAMPDDAKSCPNCGTPAPATAGTVMPPPAPGNVPSGSALPAVAPQYVVAPTEDKAIISLVLGILALVSFSILAGIPAIILGRMSRNNIRASAGRLSGEGMATAGIVMGWVSIALAGLAVLVVLAIIIFAAAVANNR